MQTLVPGPGLGLVGRPSAWPLQLLLLPRLLLRLQQLQLTGPGIVVVAAAVVVAVVVDCSATQAINFIENNIASDICLSCNVWSTRDLKDNDVSCAAATLR